MSINSALWAGATGLLANSSAMAAISDNIANVNTVGYKRSSTLFTPLYDSSKQGVSYNAGGVMASTRTSVSTPGLLTPGASATSLAVSGNGFFVVRTKAADVASTDPVYFTRAGDFSPDGNGYLRNAAGLYLFGWPVSSDGSTPANPTDVNLLEAVNLGGISGAAEATTTMRINANLRASQAVSPDEATYNPALAANNMASGAVTPDFQRNIQIFDSQGGVRTVTLSILKSANPNEWHAELHIVPASDVETGPDLVNGQIATGLIRFTPEGAYDAANSTLPASLDFLASDAAGPLVGSQVKWAANLGIGEQNVSLGLGGGGEPGGLTQYDSPSALISSQVNGSVFGSFAGVNIDEEGFVYARFTNGIVRKIYQVPVATFVNPNGLTTISGGAYATSPDSGQYTLNTPGSGASGTIASQALESSNVDIATEFTNLITTQRAYSASSKIITTADEMLDEAIRMKR